MRRISTRSVPGRTGLGPGIRADRERVDDPVSAGEVDLITDAESRYTEALEALGHHLHLDLLGTTAHHETLPRVGDLLEILQQLLMLHIPALVYITLYTPQLIHCNLQTVMPQYLRLIKALSACAVYSITHVYVMCLVFSKP